ncbi:uncharacterized protein C8Q71DRAFT_381008 [Rhodofomes roseus]|uniref:Glycoside hydrolase 131 catalytic N-terminal domain-containing protein n=1 Tax=Rhodofomes roseus TaxID=34475 RepID=A0ABQ8K173_9APHY|nr:uncharacterized protein C8Q71DRAFT_381008 [Rhodofomes roseus]KAH9830173.1 hypothetical protein C8Q71DRAFT_381008 [Rhodofomes roseus]
MNTRITSQFTITAGVPFSTAKDPNITLAKSLRVAGLQSNTPETMFFETPFTDSVWHNFALRMGWVDNTITVYYSEGYAPLESDAPQLMPTNSNRKPGAQQRLRASNLATAATNHQPSMYLPRAHRLAKQQRASAAQDSASRRACKQECIAIFCVRSTDTSSALELLEARARRARAESRLQCP